MTPNLDSAAQMLSASGEYRVLRRVPPVDRWELPKCEGEIVRGAILDVETTGLDLDVDEVIELAIVPFEYEKQSGRVVNVLAERALSSFRETAILMPEESQRVHGITPDMFLGKAIAAKQVDEALEGVQIVISHHAAFDRPMVEKLWPVFADKCFGCSFADIDWRSEELRTSKLDYLLMKQGWFHEEHRALGDALATLFLLTLPLPVSGKPALAGLLERARRPLYILQVDGYDFDHNAFLKARGFKWRPITARGESGPKVWQLPTNEPAAELDLVRGSEGWKKSSRSALRAVPPRLRYSSRIWSAA